MKKMIRWIVLIGSFLIVVTGVVLVFKRGKIHSYCDIPIEDEKLRWGMTREEIVRLLGEPDEIKIENDGEALKYNRELVCDLGKVSELTLFVGVENVIVENKEKISSGLCNIFIEIEGSTKEIIKQKLERYYGKLSDLGGSTQIELNLKEANQNYFNEYYFCDDWTVKSLNTEEYTYLSEICKNLKISINGDMPIAGINISGIAEGTKYDCIVQLNGLYVSYLKTER